ncbi:sulfurtransferase-like selenium metabolism protein YedF [bacterium]|nr:sulfurtransferase-like selenium metabolism protein YedF [bacterium]
MNQEVDARGKKCPVPLVMTKKVYETLTPGQEMTVLIDNPTSAKNVETFIRESGGEVSVDQQGETITLRLTRGEEKAVKRAEDYCQVPVKPHVILIDSDSLGDAKELGQALMQSFLQTIKDVMPLPSHVIFMNLGVSLLQKGTRTSELVQEIEALGITVLACGTCLDFYDLMDKRAVGKVTNMYEILSVLTQASRVINP